MPFDPSQRKYINAREALASTQDKQKAIARMEATGLDRSEAEEIVEEIYRENLKENRGKAFWKLAVAGVTFVVFWIVLIATGRLFYLILFFSGISLTVGLVNFFMAKGYEMETQTTDD
jgi:hypothetical protein